MKLEKRFKVEKLIGSYLNSTKKTVYMKAALLERDPGKDEHGYLVATNECALVRVPVLLDDTDVPGLVPLEALKHARNLAKREPFITLRCEATEVRTADGVRFERGNSSDFPDWRRAVPDPYSGDGEKALARALADCAELHPGVRFTLRLGINPELLVMLAEAAAAERGKAKAVELLAELELDRHERRVKISAPYHLRLLDPGSRAVLMPVRV
jgi:hypothetical protein